MTAQGVKGAAPAVRSQEAATGCAPSKLHSSFDVF